MSDPQFLDNETGIAFRQLTDGEEREYRQWAVDHPPKPAALLEQCDQGWRCYHPVVRDEWRRRGWGAPLPVVDTLLRLGGMSLQEAAQAALDVQTACNLSGVVRSFARVTETLWTEARRLGRGTDFVNEHPICRLFVEQLAHLTKAGTCDDHDGYRRAYDECVRLASQTSQKEAPRDADRPRQ